MTARSMSGIAAESVVAQTTSAPSHRVSVLIPSYNHADFILQAIDSVRAQTHEDWEIVVVDDCSTDDTAALVRQIDDPRIIFLQNERNLGINPTLARALAASTAPYVSVLGSDDALLPRKLERQIARLSQGDADIVYGGACLLHEDGSRAMVDLSAFASDFETGNVLRRAYTDDTSLPLMQSALFTRHAFEQLSQYREQVKLDDWITLIKGLELFRVVFLPEAMFLYRQHAGNTFRRYEYTLGLRLEVIAKAVPSEHRREALGRLFASQSHCLAWDGRFGEAGRYFLAAQALRPSASGVVTFLRAIAFRLRQRGRPDRLR